MDKLLLAQIILGITAGVLLLVMAGIVLFSKIGIGIFILLCSIVACGIGIAVIALIRKNK